MHISICQKDKKLVLTLNIENANLYRSEILIEKSETICLQIILPRLLTLMIDSLPIGKPLKPPQFLQNPSIVGSVPK